ncbi:MAG: hypothetical protein FJ405_13500, partial [Verrucomicrobia bacterium]|nr:hypothetical protein [Verrucomicrobiota bacterium]
MNTKTLGIISATLSCLTWINWQCNAADTKPESPKAPAKGKHELNGATVSVGIPRGWTELSQTGRISFYSPDKTSVISIRLHPTSATGQSSQLLSERTREIAQQRYHCSGILTEQPWTGLRHQGRIVDFEKVQKDAQGRTSATILSRLATTPTLNGLLEICYSAPAASFQKQMPELEGVLENLRLETPGDLQASK